MGIYSRCVWIKHSIFSRFVTSKMHSFYRSISIILAMLLLAGCRNSPESIREFSINSSSPELEVDSLHLLYTEEGQLVAEVTAPLMRNMTREGGDFDEFPQGIEVLAYDDSGRVNSMIRASYAIYQRKDKLWDARYRVVAVNEQGDSIETEQIFWDEQHKRVYTSANVKVRTSQATLFGRGFESDDRFENWEIKEPTGVISVPRPQQSTAPESKNK